MLHVLAIADTPVDKALRLFRHHALLAALPIRGASGELAQEHDRKVSVPHITPELNTYASDNLVFAARGDAAVGDTGLLGAPLWLGACSLSLARIGDDKLIRQRALGVRGAFGPRVLEDLGELRAFEVGIVPQVPQVYVGAVFSEPRPHHFSLAQVREHL